MTTDPKEVRRKILDFDTEKGRNFFPSLSYLQRAIQIKEHRETRSNYSFRKSIIQLALLFSHFLT